jgi:hypothetical protein
LQIRPLSLFHVPGSETSTPPHYLSKPLADFDKPKLIPEFPLCSGLPLKIWISQWWISVGGKRRDKAGQMKCRYWIFAVEFPVFILVFI